MPTQKETKSEILAKYSPLQKSVRLTLYLYRQSGRGKTEGVLWAGSKYPMVDERHFDFLHQIPTIVSEMMSEIGVKHDVSPHPHSDNILMAETARRNPEYYADVAKYRFKAKDEFSLELTQQEKVDLLKYIFDQQEDGNPLDSVVNKLMDMTMPEECGFLDEPLQAEAHAE